MKKKYAFILVAAALTSAGCKNPLSISGNYATPKQTISGGITTTTNSVTVTGGYSTTNQAIGGSVTVGK